jgi:hypothetical protein
VGTGEELWGMEVFGGGGARMAELQARRQRIGGDRGDVDVGGRRRVGGRALTLSCDRLCDRAAQ